MTLQLVTPPAVEPVALSEAKAFLRAGHDAEDNLILQLIASARQRVEAETGLALINRTCRETLDRWSMPGRLAANGTQFRLPLPPLVSVQSVRTYDAAGAATLWDPVNYFVDIAAQPGRIVLLTGRFPEPGRTAAGIEIEFTAGQGETPGDVPEALREAVLRLTADAYLNREGRTDQPLPMAVQSLLAPYKRVRL